MREIARLLLKAQLKDAEDKIKQLETEIFPTQLVDGEDKIVGKEEKWSLLSLLLLCRVRMHIKPGEFIAVVGGVGAGKVNALHTQLGFSYFVPHVQLIYCHRFYSLH